MSLCQAFSHKEVLLEATQIYYDYLDSHHLGVEELQIDSIQFLQDEMALSIKAQFLNVDALVIGVGNEYFAKESGLEVISYNEKSGSLIIGFLDSGLYQKCKRSQKSIRIFNDLKFLIKNLQNFFNDTKQFILPQTPNITITQPLDFSQDINAEQKQAINNILQNPLSYIWGAPGSGKTQVVLFESLLYYIYANKPVCVLAPTNNALEQILRVLIKKFDSLGLNREKILRLGIPTNSFLESYIEVCDPQIIQKRQAQNLFGTQNLKDRFQNALVIGMTIDGFIRRYRTLEIEFYHLFLDECAFTPLIKALSLCTDGIPLTLLGDHKQLMPICEMPQSEIKGEKIYANLFNLSALFLEEFFSEPLNASSKIFSKSQFSPIKHRQTISTKLLNTHRYGDNLAKILDKHIYHIGLCGKSERTEIYFIDCGKCALSDKSNLKEAQMISLLYQELKNDDIAVITPFVNQRRLLHRCGIPYKALWTIHSSQGQEFHSVIFSPVMLHYHLTNSHNLNALHALNVAMSRIKNRLIIVCDYYYWIGFKDQFLSDILRIAKPYNQRIENANL